SVRRLHAYLTDRFPLSWRVPIADNARTDRTWGIACRLARGLGGVEAGDLARKGPGRALRGGGAAGRRPVLPPTGRGPAPPPSAAAPPPPRPSPPRPGRRPPRPPPRSRLVGRARPPAGGDLPHLQPPRQGHPRRRVLRRPVRLQGGAGRCRPVAPADDRG